MGLFRGRPKKEPEKAAEPLKTPTIEMTGASKFSIPEPPKPPRLAELMTAEYAREWQGIITQKDMETIDADSMSLSLLFAIYGELRLIRDSLAQSATKEA